MASASASLVERLISVFDGAHNAVKFQLDLGGPPVEQGIGERNFGLGWDGSGPKKNRIFGPLAAGYCRFRRRFIQYAQLKLVFLLKCKQMLTKIFWNQSLWHTATQHKRFAAFYFPTPSLIYANMSFNLFFIPALLERQCKRDTCLCGNVFSFWNG